GYSIDSLPLLATTFRYIDINDISKSRRRPMHPGMMDPFHADPFHPDRQALREWDAAHPEASAA
ncbi:hypothetical protein MKK88_00010, partial [Methylobacterium sp. E-005]|uniref:hypothetical protein n=1 Tax=Methylobacterium sp. E-005 TaxID=2836549 RepID=UPI001FBA5F50